MEDMYFQDLTNTTEVVLDMRRKIRVSRDDWRRPERFASATPGRGLYQPERAVASLSEIDDERRRVVVSFGRPPRQVSLRAFVAGVSYFHPAWRRAALQKLQVVS
jgi:hypothetical protein